MRAFLSCLYLGSAAISLIVKRTSSTAHCPIASGFIFRLGQAGSRKGMKFRDRQVGRSSRAWRLYFCHSIDLNLQSLYKRPHAQVKDH